MCVLDPKSYSLEPEGYQVRIIMDPGVLVQTYLEPWISRSLFGSAGK